MLKFRKLFSPISLEGCVFPNRIFLVPMVSRLATENGHMTQALTERYKRIAEGGLGAMVVEPAVVQPSKSSFNLRIDDDRYVSEMRKFTGTVRSANPGVKIGLQLIHFLKIARSGWIQKVGDLSREEIQAIPEQFASGAQRAKAASFDFIELHMAHFTTLASFLSLVNKRNDRYGGDFEGRVKLPLEVILSIQNRVGRDFPVGVRINGEDFIKEGNTLLQSTRIARCLAQVGTDYISVSAGERFEDAETPPPNTPLFAGTGYSGSRMSPRWWSPDGANVHLAAEIRRFLRDAGFDVPVVAAGKIRTPYLAEKILQEDKADIIGLGRALFCDPDWPFKAKKGDGDKIVRCAACGYCSEADGKHKTVTCIQWPKGFINAPSPWLLVPPCKAACPVGIDIRGYIECINQGRYEDALDLIEEKLPFPATVSRVCPRSCEAKCSRAELDDPIAIKSLKRFVFDKVTSRVSKKNVTRSPRTRKEKVAIVGAGPAGLTAAFNLTNLGYGTTIFEALPFPGGMLAVGIPEYRLPKKILQLEIEGIKKHGVEIELNCPIKKGGLTLESLWQQGYKAFFIAVGAHKSVKLNVPGENMEGVCYGTVFLRQVNSGKSMNPGKRVVVLGGGNVAIDAARTALRLGSKEVVIIYRRSKEEMPSYREDVMAAETEGIKIKYLSAPVRIVGQNGKIASLECVRTELGEPDDSGRRGSIPIKSSEFVLKADMVIPAIGEVPDLSFLDPKKYDFTFQNTIKVNPRNLSTGVKGVFAGGDAVSGPATVIEAIAAGKKAAIFIDRYLNGLSLEYDEEIPRTIDLDDLDVKGLKKRKCQKMPYLSLKKRICSFREVELGFTESAALREAGRCLQCGMYPNK